MFNDMRWIRIALLVPMLSLEARAGVSHCSDYLLAQRGEVARTTLNQASRIPLADFFPDSTFKQLDNGKAVELSVYAGENLKKFLVAIEQQLAAKTNILGFPLDKFNAWLAREHGGALPIPDPFTMRNLLVANDVTVGAYVDDLIHDFVEDSTAVLPQPLGRKLTRRFRALFSFGPEGFPQKSLYALRRIVKGVGTAVFFTAILQLQGPISGFMSVPLSPITDYTGRLGTRYLSWTAAWVNDLINSIDNANVSSSVQLQQNLAGIQDALLQSAESLGKYRFKNLSKDQAKEVWDQFEHKWFDLSQNLGKMFNMNEASGRDIYLVARLGTPESYALNIATVRTNVEVTSAALAGLRERTANSQDAIPSEVQSQQIRRYERDLAFDQHLLATVIADWMLNRFFHPDLWNSTQLENTGDVAFQSIDDFLGFPEFSQDLKEQIQEVLGIINVHLRVLAKSIPDGGR